MLKKIGLGLGVVLLVLVGVIALQPAEYRVERMAVIKAPPEVVFPHVNELRRWEQWSPWEAMDPTQKSTYEGPAAGAGAITSWEGEETGKGRMTIKESREGEHVALELQFFEPMASTSMTSFAFTKVPEGVKVTWAMEGKNDFLGKAFCLVMDMDGMLGPDFEKGLSALAKVAEAEAVKRAEAEALVAAEAADAPAEATASAPAP